MKKTIYLTFKLCCSNKISQYTNCYNLSFLRNDGNLKLFVKMISNDF